MRFFISGITSGIGRGLAERFSQQNHQVFGLGRRSEKFVNENIHYTSIDLSNISILESKLRELIGAEPMIDIGILNAASLGDIKTLRNTNLASLKAQMDTNLWSQKIILDTLLDGSSKLKQIIALSSGAALNGGHGWNGYSLSKSAFKTMIEIYAQEYPDVHFVSLAPGLVDTPMQHSLNQQATYNRIPNIPSLQELKANNAISTPAQFALQLQSLLPMLPSYKSGSYIDIRTLNL